MRVINVRKTPTKMATKTFEIEARPSPDPGLWARVRGSVWETPTSLNADLHLEVWFR